MKFVCPESQKRVLLKCGNIASVSAAALAPESAGGLGGSNASGAAEEAAGVERKAVCACAQAAGAAAPTADASARARDNIGAAARRWPAQRAATRAFIMNMNFIFSIMGPNYRPTAAPGCATGHLSL